MCGICGYVYHDPARPADRAVLGAMNAMITHRGPDSDGFYVNGPAGLAMRRLAIIDVAGGDQPLSNENEDARIVFNGEIYNHPQLRADLLARGHRFRTQSDTECVIHAYEEWGDDCVQHLRGMFAFAIWDTRRRRLLLARAEHDGALLFGSELKCLRRFPGFAPSPDPLAIHYFLSLQYVPDPLTALQGARKLPPAHTLAFEDGKLTTRQYWDLDFRAKAMSRRQHCGLNCARRSRRESASG